jgi:deoxyribonuclease-4
MEKKISEVTLLLETTAGQGNDLGYKFEHFKYLIEKVKKKERIGICFDTAHSFAAGYNFLTLDNYNKVWDKFDEIIGLNYLKAFHLNDTEKELGSRVDRHAHIGKGKIGKAPFGFFINDDRFKHLPGILETPEADEKYEMNLKVLKSLRKKNKKINE